jgi:hypothetical protein
MQYIEYRLPKGVARRRVIAGNHVAAGQGGIHRSGFFRFSEELRVNGPLLIKLID